MKTLDIIKNPIAEITIAHFDASELGEEFDAADLLIFSFAAECHDAYACYQNTDGSFYWECDGYPSTKPAFTWANACEAELGSFLADMNAAKN